MYECMKLLIHRRAYACLAEVQERLDVFHAAGRLNDHEYIELTALASETYGNP